MQKVYIISVRIIDMCILYVHSISTVGEKIRTTLYYFNINYRSEIKLEPIIVHYCLLQFDALKFFLIVRQHVGIYLIFNVNPKSFTTFLKQFKQGLFSSKKSKGALKFFRLYVHAVFLILCLQQLLKRFTLCFESHKFNQTHNYQ